MSNITESLNNFWNIAVKPISENSMTVEKVRAMLQPIQDNQARTLMALEALELYPDYDCLLMEDFNDVNQVDLFSCAVAAIAQDGLSLTCPKTPGMYPGSFYTITDGLNHELVQVESVSLEDGAQTVALASALTNDYQLASCRLNRTGAGLDLGAALGAFTPKNARWAPGLTFNGHTNLIPLSTSVANSSLYDVNGKVAFTSDGLITLEV